MKKTDQNLTPAALAALAKGDLDNALVASTLGGIEAQEKTGQALLTLKFNQLPKEGMDRFRSALEKFGFTTGNEVDDIFIGIKAPDGWTLRASDHLMWSYIHDEQGRKRGGVFYKAAFYDRRANFNLQTRYQGGGAYHDNGRYSEAVDTATGEILLQFGPESDDYSKIDTNDKATFDYLDQHFPGWRNVEAYW